MTGVAVFLVMCAIVVLVIAAAIVHFVLRVWRWSWVIVVPMWFGVGWAAYELIYRSEMEERETQARVAELCKDAGPQIIRKVQVDGFYDDTYPSGVGPLSAQAIASLEEKGFRFYEYRSNSRIEGRPAVVRIVKNDTWSVSLQPRPIARYHLKRTQKEQLVGHKVWLTEDVVVDTQTGEIIGRDRLLKSLPNKVDLWWMAQFGDPTRYCPRRESKQSYGNLRRLVFVPNEGLRER